MHEQRAAVRAAGRALEWREGPHPARDAFGNHHRHRAVDGVLVHARLGVAIDDAAVLQLDVVGEVARTAIAKLAVVGILELPVGALHTAACDETAHGDARPLRRNIVIGPCLNMLGILHGGKALRTDLGQQHVEFAVCLTLVETLRAAIHRHWLIRATGERTGFSVATWSAGLGPGATRFAVANAPCRRLTLRFLGRAVSHRIRVWSTPAATQFRDAVRVFERQLWKNSAGDAVGRPQHVAGEIRIIHLRQRALPLLAAGGVHVARDEPRRAGRRRMVGADETALAVRDKLRARRLHDGRSAHCPHPEHAAGIGVARGQVHDVFTGRGERQRSLTFFRMKITVRVCAARDRARDEFLRVGVREKFQLDAHGGGHERAHVHHGRHHVADLERCAEKGAGVEVERARDVEVVFAAAGEFVAARVLGPAFHFHDVMAVGGKLILEPVVESREFVNGVERRGAEAALVRALHPRGAEGRLAEFHHLAVGLRHGHA